MDPLPIDPAQLARQAETIAALVAQRDYVLRQAAEDRERWKYERETWDRTAEALLAQKASVPTKVEVCRIFDAMCILTYQLQPSTIYRRRIRGKGRSMTWKCGR